MAFNRSQLQPPARKPSLSAAHGRRNAWRRRSMGRSEGCMAGMSRERWEAVSPHLDRALGLAPTQREELLDSLRAEQPELAEDLETLLAASEALEHAVFLDTTPEMPGASLA